jgi:hypothetical protein
MTTPVSVAPISADTTDPHQSNIKVTQKLNLDCLHAKVWHSQVKTALIAKNVFECICSDMTGTKGDSVAFSVVTENIESQWFEEVLDMSAFAALSHLVAKFSGGTNHSLISETSLRLDTQCMTKTETISEYVLNKSRSSRILKDNLVNVQDERLKRGIVKGLPKVFDAHSAMIFNVILGKDIGNNSSNQGYCILPVF